MYSIIWEKGLEYSSPFEACLKIRQVNIRCIRDYLKAENKNCYKILKKPQKMQAGVLEK